MNRIDLTVALVFTILQIPVLAQQKQWHLTFGYGTSYSGATIAGHREFQPHRESILRVHNRFSQQWTGDGELSGLKTFPNFLYTSQFTIGIERKLNEKFSFQSGIELGGRHFTVTEYRTENGREHDDIFTTAYANRVNRGYLVTSLPLLLKYGRPGTFTGLKGVFGLVVNYGHSFSYNSAFYRSNGINTLFTNLYLGMEYREPWLGQFSLSLGYHAGFTKIIRDEVILYSALRTGIPAQTFNVESRGNNLQLCVRYYLKLQTKFAQEDTDPTPSSVIPVTQTKELEVPAGNLEICVSDKQTVDGDSISIMKDRTVLVSSEVLTNEEKCYPITSDTTDGYIELLIYALNEGRITPNTLTFVVKSNGREVNNIFLRTDTSSAIRILLKITAP